VKDLVAETSLLVFLAFLLVLVCYMALRLVGIEDGVTGEALTMLVGGVLALARVTKTE
jgi:hypothetical protein